MTDVRIVVDRTNRRDAVDRIPDAQSVRARRICCPIAPKASPSAMGLDLLRALGKRPAGRQDSFDSLDLASLWLDGEGIEDVFIPHAETLNAQLLPDLIETVSPEDCPRRLWLIDMGAAPATHLYRHSNNEWSATRLAEHLWTVPRKDAVLPRCWDVGAPPDCDPVILDDIASRFYSPRAQALFTEESRLVEAVVRDTRVPLDLEDEEHASEVIAGRVHLLLRSAVDRGRLTVRARLAQSEFLRRGWHVHFDLTDTPDIRVPDEELGERLRWYVDPCDGALAATRILTGLSAVDLQRIEVADISPNGRRLRFAGVDVFVPEALAGLFATQRLRREEVSTSVGALFTTSRFDLVERMSTQAILDRLSLVSAETGYDLSDAGWPTGCSVVASSVRQRLAFDA